MLVLTSSDGSVQALNVSAPPGAVPDAGGVAGSAAARDISLVAGDGLRLCRRADPERHALRAADPGDEGAGAGRPWRRRQAKRRSEGFAYAAGAVLSFLVFGLVIVLLRQGGAGGGLGLSAAGAHRGGGFCAADLRGGAQSVRPVRSRHRHGGRQPGTALGRLSGAFFTGVLAVAVAAPCTAPFMAAALGFALTQSVLSALLIFLGLGLGFALPFLILGVWPRRCPSCPSPAPGCCG